MAPRDPVPHRNSLTPRVGFSPFVAGGRRVYQDVIQQVYDQTNAMFGTEIPAPGGNR